MQRRMVNEVLAEELRHRCMRWRWRRGFRPEKLRLDLYSNGMYKCCMEDTNLKDERLQVRLDGQSKQILQRAASYRSKGVSQFVLSTALAEAEKIIREHEAITLSKPDWARLLDTLAHPPKPNKALRKAYAVYAKAKA